MPRTQLACSICVDDDFFYLAETIRSVEGVAPVFVFVRRVAWHDEPGDWEQTVRIAEVAQKLARIIYRLLTTRTPYDETVYARAEEHHRERRLQRLRREANALGFHFAPLGGIS